MTADAAANLVDDAPVKTSLSNGIFRLTLNRPKKRNCLSEELLDGIQAALDAAEADTACRVIVINAEGPGFCSGHDLKELTAARQNEDAGRAYIADIMDRCARMMQTIVQHRVPVIADVRGIATAAGCQLVASCDLALATNNVQFATPGVNIGLFCSTPMVALSRNLSRKHAMEMLLLGDMIPAERAAELGLINRVVEPELMDAAVNEMASKIAEKSSLTLKIGKQAFYQQAEMNLADAYTFAANVMVDNMLTHDAEEGIGAFIEKRHPQWEDR